MPRASLYPERASIRLSHGKAQTLRGFPSALCPARVPELGSTPALERATGASGSRKRAEHAGGARGAGLPQALLGSHLARARASSARLHAAPNLAGTGGHPARNCSRWHRRRPEGGARLAQPSWRVTIASSCLSWALPDGAVVVRVAAAAPAAIRAKPRAHVTRDEGLKTLSP